jgi:hypothetical protein
MRKSILIMGDVLAIFVVTFIGFASHGEAGLSFLPRMAAIFFPLVIAWFILAPLFGLFQPEIVMNRNQIWRPALAMIFAGSMAVVIRGLILNAPVIPIFAVVLAATSALGILIWRVIYLFVNRTIGASRSAYRKPL